MVILIGLEMLLRERQKEKKKTSKIVLAVLGIISGLLSGLYGIGALLAAYISRTTDDSHAFKGNLCIVFVVENTFRIILYTATGIITKTVFISAVTLIPLMLVGLLGGMLLAKVLNEKVVRKLVIVLLILSGVSLILTNIL